ARLAVCAAAQNVDAGVSLQAHCLDHRLGEARLECRFVIRLARLRFLQIRNHRGRAHHTAHMAHDEAAISSQHSLLPWSCVPVASHRPRSSEAAFRVTPGPKGGVRIESAAHSMTVKSETRWHSHFGRVWDGRGSLGHAAFAEEPVGEPFPHATNHYRKLLMDAKI